MNERSQWNEMEPKWSQCLRVFAFYIALYVVSNNEDQCLKSTKVIDNEKIYKWKETILVKSNLLHKLYLVLTRSLHTWSCEVKWISMIFSREKGN